MQDLTIRRPGSCSGSRAVSGKIGRTDSSGHKAKVAAGKLVDIRENVT